MTSDDTAQSLAPTQNDPLIATDPGRTVNPLHELHSSTSDLKPLPAVVSLEPKPSPAVAALEAEPSSVEPSIADVLKLLGELETRMATQKIEMTLGEKETSVEDEYAAARKQFDEMEAGVEDECAEAENDGMEASVEDECAEAENDEIEASVDEEWAAIEKRADELKTTIKTLRAEMRQNAEKRETEAKQNAEKHDRTTLGLQDLMAQIAGMREQMDDLRGEVGIVGRATIMGRATAGDDKALSFIKARHLLNRVQAQLAVKFGEQAPSSSRVFRQLLGPSNDLPDRLAKLEELLTDHRDLLTAKEAQLRSDRPALELLADFRPFVRHYGEHNIADANPAVGVHAGVPARLIDCLSDN